MYRLMAMGALCALSGAVAAANEIRVWEGAEEAYYVTNDDTVTITQPGTFKMEALV